MPVPTFEQPHHLSQLMQMQVGCSATTRFLLGSGAHVSVAELGFESAGIFSGRHRSFMPGLVHCGTGAVNATAAIMVSLVDILRLLIRGQ